MTENIRRKESPSQTAGPYVHIGCIPNAINIANVYPFDLGSGPPAKTGLGDVITICGQIFDGAGVVVKDAMLESWQAESAKDNSASTQTFFGWARHICDLDTGWFEFQTIKPGPIDTRGGWQSPHIALWIVARGINRGLHTRLYFSDEDNTSDSILTALDPVRRKTLIAVENDGAYGFDIHLQGKHETVFFDI